MKPISEIAISFRQSLSQLNDYFYNSIDMNELGEKLTLFFNDTDEILKKIEQDFESSLTYLFEIDQTLNGSYGEIGLLSNTENKFRKLLKDMLALWYNFYILSYLERKYDSFPHINNIRSFYITWEEYLEQNGKSEFGIILDDLKYIISPDIDLPLNVKVIIFDKFCEIFYNTDDKEVIYANSVMNLQNYKEEINNRETLSGEESKSALLEIILNIYVVNTYNKSLIPINGIELDRMLKSIKLWAANDEVLQNVLKYWGIIKEYDFETQLTESEISELRSNKMSLSNYLDNEFGIGQSYKEYSEYQKSNFGLNQIINPIKLALVGSSGVGKTSYLTALAYKIFQSSSISMHNSYLEYYNSLSNSWTDNQIVSSSSDNEISLGSEQINLSLYDYNGSLANPQAWSDELKNHFISSKAFVFIFDAQDLINDSKVTESAKLYESYLNLWSNNNPNIKHIPIAIVINKLDKFLFDELQSMDNYSLIPNDLKREIIEIGSLKRGIDDKNVHPLKKLEKYLENIRENNKNSVIQDLISALFSKTSSLMERIIKLTYNYQIFVVSSSHHFDTNYIPFGAEAPIEWVLDVFKDKVMEESVSIYRNEINEVNGIIKDLESDNVALINQIDMIRLEEAEIQDLLNSSSLSVKLMRDYKIKNVHQPKIENAKQNLTSLYKRYERDPEGTDYNEFAKFLDNEIKKNKNFVSEIEEKIRNYENSTT